MCVSDDALTPAHVPTHKQRLKQAYIRIHMHIYSNVWVFSWMEFEFDVLFSCLALPPTKHIHTHTHTQTDTHLTNTKANANLLFYEWLSRAAAEFPMCVADNLVLSPFILTFLLCLFLDNTTFSYRLMCVRQYRERSTPRPRRVLMNGQRCLYRCTWLLPLPSLSLSLCLFLSICLL